jgi:glucose/arabinose dehydrogenase
LRLLLEHSSEGGLLGLAFHPDYPENPAFFVNFTYEDNGQYKTRISRFQAPGGIADPNSEQIILEFDQPGENHNGGALGFGPDGYLYISSGDGGGSAKDNPQNTLNLLGGILRIDIDTNDGYLIPPDNPFVGNSDGLNELYAWGLRNPWRMSFDRETGHLWVADVGSSRKEVIHIIEKGKNYGYPIIEGSICRSADCDMTGLEMPLFEYEWGLEETGKSITGGYVYRGSANPSLYGKYIYGDYVSGRMWALEVDHETLNVISNTELIDTDLRIPSFGIDSENEIYVIGWGSNSKVYRFAPELTLTTATLKSVDGASGVQLSWDVNRDSGIAGFEIYKGPSVDEMELYNSVDGNDRSFIDTDPLEGSTFYSVRATESDGDEGDMSSPVSYYRSTETISDGWQMISIPYETEGLSIANTLSYSFDGSYNIVDQLQPGQGYLIRSTEAEGTDFSAEGIGVQRLTLELARGWNLVGGLIGELSNEFLIDDGGILNSTPVFGFSGFSYVESNTFMPGQGYWVYADETGEITLDLETQSSSLPLKTIVSKEKSVQRGTENFDILEFESGGEKVELFVSENAVSPELLNRYRVPPVAPNSVLDVRTTEGFRLAEGHRVEPQVTLKDSPLLVRFASAGENEQMPGSFSRSSEVVYTLTVYRDGKSESVELMEGESYLIANAYDQMELQRTEIDNEIVQQTELLPSYPNPFNPVTNISYRLSEQQQVTLTVFDAAGRRIATLVDGEQGAGQYNLPFDASGLASGIYFVRFSAGDVLSTQKLTLIK